MNTFQVPQFLDIEDRLVGPLTLKQFGFIATAFLLSVGLFYILQFWLWLIITVALAAFAISLAFIKVSGRPAFIVLLNVFEFYWRPRRYIWQHEIPAPIKVTAPEIKEIRLPEAPSTKQTRRIAIPRAEVNVPTVTVTKKPELKANAITEGQGLKQLSNQLLTSTRAIPKREKAFAWLRRAPAVEYETLQKTTGERIQAKRVDYR